MSHPKIWLPTMWPPVTMRWTDVPPTRYILRVVDRQVSIIHRTAMKLGRVPNLLGKLLVLRTLVYHRLNRFEQSFLSFITALQPEILDIQ